MERIVYYKIKYSDVISGTKLGLINGKSYKNQKTAIEDLEKAIKKYRFSNDYKKIFENKYFTRNGDYIHQIIYQETNHIILIKFEVRETQLILH